MYALWLAGWKLSAAAAPSLEARLREDPDDLEARITLIGYYSRHEDPRLIAHGVWFVDNRPELEIWAMVDVVAEELSHAWRRALAQHPDDARLLANASVYFARAEAVVTEPLLRRGAELEPGAAHWHASLARIGVDPLAELDHAIALASSDEERFGYVLEAAHAALDAGARDLAASYAERVLADAATVTGTWNHGNGLHHAQIILGKLALASGDLATAKERLLASTRGPSSPQLSSSGPDQALALALLERGERDAVGEYAEASTRAFGGGLGLLGALYRDEPPQLRVIK